MRADDGLVLTALQFGLQPHVVVGDYTVARCRVGFFSAGTSLVEEKDGGGYERFVGSLYLTPKSRGSRFCCCAREE